MKYKVRSLQLIECRKEIRKIYRMFANYTEKNILVKFIELTKSW